MRVLIGGILAIVALLMMFVWAYTSQVEECEEDGGEWARTGEKVTSTTFITINNTITPVVTTQDEYGCTE